MTDFQSFGGEDMKHPAKKQLPRGRPWPKGVSGNRAGRPRGSLNKTTEAVIAGVRQAEVDLMLNKDLPFNAWRDCYVQFGLIYHKQTLRLLDPSAPALPRPEKLNLQEPFQEIIWEGRHLYLQDGWSV